MTLTNTPPIRHLLVAGLPLMAALWTSSALAQSAQPGAILMLDPIVLENGTLAEDLRDSIRQAPGSADVIGAEEIATNPPAPPTFSDAVAGVPGVIVQEFFGGNDQPRFQIRGSGTQQSPTERGLLMMWNGMPVNRADGSYIAGFAAPGQSEAIEIWRGGAAANRLGASVLGGVRSTSSRPVPQTWTARACPSAAAVTTATPRQERPVSRRARQKWCCNSVMTKAMASVSSTMKANGRSCRPTWTLSMMTEAQPNCLPAIPI